MPRLFLLSLLIASCSLEIATHTFANPTPTRPGAISSSSPTPFSASPATQSQYRYNIVIALSRGATRLQNYKKANVGDRLSLQYTVYVTERATDKLLCSEPLRPTEIKVDPEKNVFLDSLYTVDSGGITEHDFKPVNPFRFIPRSKGPLKVTVTGQGCTKQHPHPWKLERTINIAGATVTLLQEHTWSANGAIFHVASQILLFADERHPTGIQIPFRVQNDMDRPASFTVIGMFTQDQHYLVVNNERVPLITVQQPALDPSPREDGSYFIFSPVFSATLNPGQSHQFDWVDRPSMHLGNEQWRSPRRGGEYQALGFHSTFQTFILQDYDKVNDAQFSQTPIGESVVSWEIAAQAYSTSQGWSINRGVSRAIQSPQLMPQLNFAPAYSAPIQNKKFTRSIYNWRTKEYFLLDNPRNVGQRMSKIKPPNLS